MEKKIMEEYTAILREELLPASGCTEPIAVAYCAALAANTLGCRPERVIIRASANIIKNVKSVVVPNTNGLRGISAAAAAGIISGNHEAMLEVLSGLSKTQVQEIADFLDTAEFLIERSEQPWVFDIQTEVSAAGHSAMAELAGHHTNLILLKKDDQILKQTAFQDTGTSYATDRSLLNVKDIVRYAEEVDLEEVRDILNRQIRCNTAIAEEGLHGNYGANIGRILLKSYGDGLHNRARAFAAAGSDARMSGCDLPVVINSGSGNQGLTASLPVIVYAREMNVSETTLLQALIVSNLISIHLKTGIGSLSAYCGAVSAGCGAGAGISWLYGGRYYEIAHVVVNAIAINSGMICDGAKASCAAKIASAVEAGLLGLQMQLHDSQFFGGDGIITKGVENTIRNIGILAREGMQNTDRTIIELMTQTGC